MGQAVKNMSQKGTKQYNMSLLLFKDTMREAGRPRAEDPAHTSGKGLVQGSYDARIRRQAPERTWTNGLKGTPPTRQTNGHLAQGETLINSHPEATLRCHLIPTRVATV